MDFKKIILYFILAISGFSLWNIWQQEHAAVQAPTQQGAIPINTPSTSNSTIPTIQSNTPAPISAAAKTTTISNPITISTNFLNITIDPKGGNIVKATLPKYYNVAVFDNQPDDEYVAQSGLISTTQSGPASYPTFTSAQTHYELTNNQPRSVVLTAHDQGLVITKTYTVDPNSYLITLQYSVTNDSSKVWSGNLFTQLTRTPPKEESAGFFKLPSYTGAAYSNSQGGFEKLSFEDMVKEQASGGWNQPQMTGGWVSMMQHYFVSAWIPSATQTSTFYSKVPAEQLYTIGYLSPTLNVPAGATENFSPSKLYVGPAIADQLNQAAPNLNDTIGYGWLSIISGAIFWMMNNIHKVVGNWGWSIVLVTLLIKALFYKLSAASYRSMAKMRKLQPRLAALKEKHGDDKQAFQKATMELYRSEKANPLLGCLPILVQIPIFIGLYYVLLQSVDLWQAPFIFWIKDLSVHDPLYILPVLMGISMLVQQKLSPPPPDPMQAKVMMLLPIMFTAFFLKFPAGLVLYWLVNNIASILQQWYIMRKVDRESTAKHIVKEKK